MDRAYLRPPQPLYQAFAALAALPLVLACVAIWAHRLPDLARLYLRDYVRASVPRLPSLRLVPGRARVAPHVERHVLIYYVDGSRYEAATDPLNYARRPRLVVITTTRAAYAAWLRRDVYGGRSPLVLLMPPLLGGLLLAVKGRG